MSDLALPKPVKPERKRRTRPRRTRKVRPGRVSLKTLDDVARRLCRDRGRCEAASYTGPDGPAGGCKGVLQWAHIIGRSYHRVRWAGYNCLCLCAAHHKFWTDRPVQWRRFLLWKIGAEHLEALERKATSDEPKPLRTDLLAELREYEAVSWTAWVNRFVVNQ